MLHTRRTNLVLINTWIEVGNSFLSIALDSRPIISSTHPPKKTTSTHSGQTLGIVQNMSKINEKSITWQLQSQYRKDPDKHICAQSKQAIHSQKQAQRQLINFNSQLKKYIGVLTSFPGTAPFWPPTYHICEE